METKTTNRLQIAGERKPYTRDQLVTLGDLDEFRNELLKEMKYLLAQKHAAPEKKWLKSGEVRSLLQISSGTLQHLRDTGQLPFTKLGGIIYYDRETIKTMMDQK